MKRTRPPIRIQNSHVPHIPITSLFAFSRVVSMRRAAENERSGIRQLTVKKRNSTAGIYRDTEGKRQGEQYPSELENIVIGPFFRYAASHPATVLNSGETGDLDLLAREMLLTMDREVVAP